VLLHGFAQDSSVWDPIAGQIHDQTISAPDLRGHGKAHSMRPISSEDLATDLADLLDDQRPSTVAGYSMGGRLALEVAIRYPRMVSRLVLISTSAGLRSESERVARQESDQSLSSLLRTEGLEAFSRYWTSLPLWIGDPKEVTSQANQLRLRQNPLGLAAALDGFGAGNWPHRWDELSDLQVPVELVVGARDSKYLEINQEMHRLLPQSRLTVVEGAGHSLLLESRQEIVKILGLDSAASNSGKNC